MSEMDYSLQKAAAEISMRHREIINDWCKAYMAQLYEETGSIKPGDFVLHTQIDKDGWKYWFEPKEK